MDSVSIGPYRLEVPVVCQEAVDRVVSLAAGAEVAADGIRPALARVDALSVDLANIELDRRVVLGSDEAPSGRALARNV